MPPNNQLPVINPLTPPSLPGPQSSGGGFGSGGFNPPTNNVPTPAASPKDQFSQLVDRLNKANNVMITVSDSPSVDQLAACIGLTLALNKKGKHATAVFSGEVPSTIEFLEPERTIETNTDSLRDFIISLDKSKADKLRYKVEDDFVKIFITPYKTSIDEKDLNFSQGDFNIDLVIMLGIHDQAQLDAAITAHGRILHDATVAALNTDSMSNLGSINWVDNNASSLCEMVSDLVVEIGKDLLDPQISTSLLTGMVAETDRFGNDKAQPHTMSVAGVLMSAGASAQLVSSKLEEPEPEPEPEPEEPAEEIPPVAEEESEESTQPPELEEPEQPEEPEPEEPEAPADNTAEDSKVGKDGTIQIDHDDDIHIDDEGTLRAIKDLEEEKARQAEEEAQKAAGEAAAALSSQTQQEAQKIDEPEEEPEEPRDPDAPQISGVKDNNPKIVLDPPKLGGQLTANTVPEHQQYSGTSDPMSQAAKATGGTTLSRPSDNQTLSDIERSVNSTHVAEGKNGDVPDVSVDTARSAVEQAANNPDNYRPQPINALGAKPLDLNLGNNPDDNGDEPKTESDPAPSSPPPPVPPPMMPPANP